MKKLLALASILVATTVPNLASANEMGIALDLYKCSAESWIIAEGAPTDKYRDMWKEQAINFFLLGDEVLEKTGSDVSLDESFFASELAHEKADGSSTTEEISKYANDKLKSLGLSCAEASDRWINPENSK